MDDAVTPLPGVRFGVWGLSAELQVTDPAALVPGRACLDAVLAAFDLACSRFRDDSELTAVNRACGAAVPVSPLFLEAVGVALRAAELTGGAVDPTCGKALTVLGYDRDYAELRLAGASAASTVAVPRPAPGWRTVLVDRERGTVQVPGGVLLDLGATAKALAADRAAAWISAELGCGTLVNLGGDIAVAGDPPPGGWAVRAVEDPDAEPHDEPYVGRHAGPEAAPSGETVAIRDGGVATSGTTLRTWQRGDRTVHHIVSPRTGDAAEPYWRTATAVAGSCVDANTLTTAAIVMGEDALAWAANLGCPLRLVRHDGDVVRVGGWPDPGEAR